MRTVWAVSHWFTQGTYKHYNLSRQEPVCSWQSQDSRIQAVWWHYNSVESEWVSAAGKKVVQKPWLDNWSSLGLATSEQPEEWDHFFYILCFSKIIWDKDIAYVSIAYIVYGLPPGNSYWTMLKEQHTFSDNWHAVHLSPQPSGCDGTRG